MPRASKCLCGSACKDSDARMRTMCNCGFRGLRRRSAPFGHVGPARPSADSDFRLTRRLRVGGSSGCPLIGLREKRAQMSPRRERSAAVKPGMPPLIDKQSRGLARTPAMPNSRVSKRSASAPLPRRLTKSSSMSSYNADGVPMSEGLPELLNLPSQVKNVLTRQISAAVEDVLDSMTHEGTEDAHWRGKMRKDGIVYYEDTESVTKGQTRFCCVDSTDASVEDVVNLFLVSDTDMLLQQCRIMYDNIIDARILNVLEHPSEEHPMRSTYIRYTAFKARTLQRNHRDMCVVVSTDVLYCQDGSTIGYCVWDSLNLPDVSELDVPQGFIRTRMFRSGYFVQNSGLPDAQTKVVYIVGIEAGGLAPRLTTRYYMPRFGQVLSRVIAHLRRRQLDPSVFVPESQWTDKRTAEFCQCCSKHFGAVKLLDTRRYNCVVCGDAICHACHHVEEVEVPDARNTKVGICVGCKTDTQKRSRRMSRWSSWGTSFSTDSTESSTRSLRL